ncbi:MAG: MoaD/ThiS family protein [Candidatus Thermoplasmatota archaeon]|nr:MoaD/ThiS family protein [Candidatus Thermoplasmatota archaeon]
MRLTFRVLPSGEDQTLRLDEGADGFELIETLHLNPETYVILRNGRPIPVDSSLQDGDDLSIVSVISGG